jgi:hypothetical protein
MLDVAWRLVEIVVRLRREAESFVFDRPIPILTDQFQDNPGLNIDPFEKSLGATVEVGLHLIELGVAPTSASRSH